MLGDSSSENLELIEEHPESIAADQIVIFSLKTDKIRVLNSHEISYNNEMYDIILTKNTKDDVILYCISDIKDTRLHTVFRSLNDLSDNPFSTTDNFAITILKNLLKNYLPPDGNRDPLELYSIELSLNKNLNFQSFIPWKIYPPPRTQIINC